MAAYKPNLHSAYPPLNIPSKLTLQQLLYTKIHKQHNVVSIPSHHRSRSRIRENCYRSWVNLHYLLLSTVTPLESADVKLHRPQHLRDVGQLLSHAGLAVVFTGVAAGTVRKWTLQDDCPHRTAAGLRCTVMQLCTHHRSRESPLYVRRISRRRCGGVLVSALLLCCMRLICGPCVCGDTGLHSLW